MKRGPFVLVGVLVCVVFGAGVLLQQWRHRPTRPTVMPRGQTLSGAPPQAPPGVRIRVQVLNTTRTRGLARRATRLLRDQGFDVVEMGTAGPLRDSTLILDRSGHPAWAAAVAGILGPGARAEARPDSSRYLDVTVLLGRAWRAPAEPLNP